MNCIYCQNYEISQQGRGKEITIEELADMLEVMISLAALEEKSLDDIIVEANKKREKRGGFKEKIYLKSVKK